MTDKPSNKLTIQQQRFCDEILKGMNAQDAYIEAGYKSKADSLSANSSRLLSNPIVQLELQKRRTKVELAVDASRERILREFCKLAFVDPAELIDENGNNKSLKDISPEARAAITGIDVIQTRSPGRRTTTTYRYRLESKKGALDSLAKIQGLFIDRHSIEFNVETLSAILTGLPENLAMEVKAALAMTVIKK
jgi:phage terminase small subunit